MKYIYLLSALFGLLLPMAVRAQNVSNTGAYPHYASPYVFHKNTATDIGYAYNSNGSMTRNPDRHIGLIEYDSFNNPRLIQFTDGSVTEYVYDASGVKLKALHRTAVPGIEVPYGTVYEHTSSTVLSSDSTLYAGPFVLSGGSLRYKYDGGSVLIPLDGSPVKPTFYALDHLGSVRLVVSADGQVIERNDYYPSGCLITENIDGETVILPYKYNGKELDPMHGLYTYDYGARQYDPATMLWDRMDPLCEDNPEVSPYVYCLSNPVNIMDPDGKKVYGVNAEARRNIEYTLTIDEAKYLFFDSNGNLDVSKLMQCGSTSNNFTALMSLAKSETNYIFMVSDKDINGDVFYEKGTDTNNPDNYSYGVTNMPGADNNPSPDDNVYIYTFSSLDEKRQVRNTAHEGYGHAFFYELNKRNPSINPNHTKGLVGHETIIDPDYGSVFIGVYGNNNFKLEEQIKKVEQEAIRNYESR